MLSVGNLQGTSLESEQWGQGQGCPILGGVGALRHEGGAVPPVGLCDQMNANALFYIYCVLYFSLLWTTALILSSINSTAKYRFLTVCVPSSWLISSVRIFAQTPHPSQTRWCNTWTLPSYKIMTRHVCRNKVRLRGSQLCKKHYEMNENIKFYYKLQFFHSMSTHKDKIKSFGDLKTFSSLLS